MRRYFDLDTEQLLLQRTGSPVVSETVRLGATYRLEIQTIRAGINLALADGTTGLLQLNISGLYSGPGSALTAPGELIAGAWVFAAFIDSAAIRSQLGPYDSATFDAVVSFIATDGETLSNSNTVTFVVTNAGRPSLTGPVDLPLANVTRLTGGNPLTDLDAQPFNGYAAGSKFSVTIDQGGEVLSESRWEKRASTAATSLTNGVIRIAGFNALTNAFVLVRVAGA